MHIWKQLSELMYGLLIFCSRHLEPRPVFEADAARHILIDPPDIDTGISLKEPADVSGVIQVLSADNGADLDLDVRLRLLRKPGS